MKKWLDSPIGRLRLAGIAEGVSALVLFFIAMPLKYLVGMPEMVKVVGWAHGVLFVLFMVMVLFVYHEKNWPFKKVILAFIAAFLPFGTFVFDAQLKKEEALQAS